MIDADLIHDYLDGELDAATARELAQWLLAAPENRALFRREVALASALAERAERSPSQRSATSARHSNAPSSALGTSARQRAKSQQHLRLRRSPLGARLFTFGAVAAVLAISSLLVVQQTTAVPLPETSGLVIGDAHGPVSVLRGDALLAKLPARLQAGDRLHIGTAASVRLEMDQGRTRIWGAGDTTLVIAAIREPRDRIGTRLEIAQGSLLIEAAPQPSAAPLRLRSARSEAEVVGTVLSFTALPDRDRLMVAHGMVSFGRLAGDQRSQVSAGGFAENDGVQVTVDRLAHQPPAAVTKARVTGFAMVDDSTGLPIPGYAQLASGCVIDLAGLRGRKINLRADVAWPQVNKPGHVVLHYDNDKPIGEAVEPYSLLSDVLPLANAVPAVRFAAGVHALVATPYSGDISRHPASERHHGGSGDPGHAATLIFTVINSAP